MNGHSRKLFKPLVAVVAIMVLAFPMVIFASEVDTSVVDVTTPTGSVKLAPGGSGPITINMSVSGNQEGTATFEVYRDWTLTGGTFTGRNPQEFVVAPRTGGAPAATFSTTGTVSVAAGQANGTFLLTVGVFDITNTNTEGAKLRARNSAAYSVTVEAATPPPPPPPANTPPTVSVTGVTDGASYNKGSVPAATCNVTDAEDGNSSFDAILSSITGMYASDGVGSQTASCSYTDRGGLTASASTTYIIVDPSAPIIGSAVNPASADGSNGWYKSDVSLTWTVSEPQSPNSLNKTGCVDQNITADQASTAYSCLATSAGGSAGPVSVSIKRDATRPTAPVAGFSKSAEYTDSASGTAWYKSNVTVSYSGASDATSGIDTASYATAEEFTTTGAHRYSGTVKDNAGNESLAASGVVNVDATAPTVSFTDCPTGPVIAGSNVSVNWTAGDIGSGIASNATSSMALNTLAVGRGKSVTAPTATDNVGNTSSVVTCTFNVEYAWSNFLQPINAAGTKSSFKHGSTIPVKFQLVGASAGITDAVAKLSWRNVGTSTSGEAEATNYVPGDPGNVFRYSDGQYIFNLSTKNLTAGEYELKVDLGDGVTTRTVNITIRK